jgi:hypothetical protein
MYKYELFNGFCIDFLALCMHIIASYYKSKIIWYQICAFLGEMKEIGKKFQCPTIPTGTRMVR